MIEFTVNWILIFTFVVGTVLPLLVAIVSTKVTSSKKKGILLALFALLTSVLSGVIDALVNGTVYDLAQNFVVFGGVFAWAVVSYFGIFRATNTEGVSITSSLTENVGRTK